ncbi:MAG: 6-phosphogluconolactonase [Nocardioides sp.]|nr:6-phosphogluconolactonase [Nocardioides sp.]
MSLADSTRVEVHADAPALATAIAGALLRRLAEAQADGGVPQIGLTGGTIADAMHHELARLSPASDVDWTRVVLWWVDERFVPATSPERNAAAARLAFIDALGVPVAHVHEMASADDASDVVAGAAAYAELVRAHGSGELEVVMFGMGADGHVASLFPGSAHLLVDDEIAVAVTDSPKPPRERISLTLPALNRSRAVWFLVSGGGKAEAVARALSGEEPEVSVAELPAVGVHGTTETVWFLDKASASHL